MAEQQADQHERGGGELIAFTPARSENYVGGFIRELRQQAEQAGYAVSIFENEFDQAQQDRQVRRQIESGARPDMWLWWPVDADEALESLQALHDTGIPVLQINQLPSEQARQHVVAFVGPDDVLRAKNAAMLINEAHYAMLERDNERAGESGNILAVTYPRSYGGYSLCRPAFRDSVEENGMTVVREVEAGFGASKGYTATKRALAGLDDDVDCVYGMDDALLQGAIRAFEEAGYHVGVPGESDADVVAVGTVANGDRVLMLDGRQYGTTLQAPLLEGQLAIQVADEYLTTGAVETFANFTPNPAVRHSEFVSFTLEGFDGEMYTMDELASWQHARQTGGAVATEAPFLRMRAINRSFGNIEALKEVSFELRRGEVMALVGENGAGKSTLVKVIAGFDHGYTGTIELDGEAVEFATPAQAEEAGIAIAQQGFLIYWLRIHSIVFTVGTLMLLRGVSLLVANEQTVVLREFAFGDFLKARWGLFSSASLTALLIFVGLGLFMRYHKYAREIYAIGSARREALAAGVSLMRPLVIAFLVSGLCAGLAGAIVGLRSGSARPLGLQPLLLTGTTAAFVGGVSLQGGKGSAFGAALGTLTIRFLETGLNFRATPAFISDIVLGTLLLIVIMVELGSQAFDRYQTRRALLQIVDERRAALGSRLRSSSPPT